MLSGRKSEDCKKESTTWDMDGEREDYGRYAVGGFKVELPPPFRGDGQKPFATWIKQFEAAVRAQTRGASSAGYNDTLANILPTRLDGAAFLLWDSLPGTVQWGLCDVMGACCSIFCFCCVLKSSFSEVVILFAPYLHVSPGHVEF